MSILARAATAADAPWLATLAERTFRDTYAEHNTVEDMESYVAAHFGSDLQAAELVDPRRFTLVAEVDGAPAGYAQLGRTPVPACVPGEPSIEILRFYVDRPWHGQGVAGRLMESVAQHARSEGMRTLWLGVWERNPRAIAFYRKSGFVDVGRQTFVLGADHQRDLVLARRLD